MVNLGQLPGALLVSSSANGVSGDGNVVVGASNSSLGREAFRWSASDGMVGLGDLPGALVESSASAVSSNGSVIVGVGMPAFSSSEAVLWNSSGITGLGDLPSAILGSYAYDVSANGTVVVGVGNSTGTLGDVEAIRWTSGSGMVGLGFLPGHSISAAYGVSANGSVIVGFSRASPPAQAVIWTAADGMRSIAQLLTAQGINVSGWTLESAKSVSDDGRIIVGNGMNPSGVREGWIATLP